MEATSSLSLNSSCTGFLDPAKRLTWGYGARPLPSSLQILPLLQGWGKGWKCWNFIPWRTTTWPACMKNLCQVLCPLGTKLDPRNHWRVSEYSQPKSQHSRTVGASSWDSGPTFRAACLLWRWLRTSCSQQSGGACVRLCGQCPQQAPESC